jgi:hypothetical protein
MNARLTIGVFFLATFPCTPLFAETSCAECIEAAQEALRNCLADAISVDDKNDCEENREEGMKACGDSSARPNAKPGTKKTNHHRTNEHVRSRSRREHPHENVRIGRLAAMGGYAIGLISGIFLIEAFSNNRHDRSVEAAMTGAVVVGPLMAVVAVIVLLVIRARRAQ